MWVDNVDVVLNVYFGIGVMKIDLMRMGKRIKVGVLQDGNVVVMRYCKNNFLDGLRQDVFDLFLGVY